MRFLYYIPLRRLLIVPGMVVLVLSNAVLLIAFLMAGGTAVQVSVNDLHAQITSGVSAELSRYLNTALALNETNQMIVGRGVFDLQNQAYRERFFSGQLGVHYNAAMTFVGLPTGEFYGARRTIDDRIEVVRNNETTGGASRYYAVSEDGEGSEFIIEYPGFDPRTRPWYHAAADRRAAVFSPIYRHFVFNDLAVTAALPHFNPQGELVAVFGADILLQRLSQFLGRLGAETDSVILVVERDSGYLIANSHGLQNFVVASDGAVSRNTPAAFPHHVVGTVWKAAQDEAPLAGIEFSSATSAPVGDGAGGSPRTDGRIVRAAPYQTYNLDWVIVIGLSRQRFLGRVYAAALFGGLGVLLLFWFLLVAAQRAVNTILSPIDTLVAAAAALSHRNWNIQIESRGTNEMAVLSRAFSVMSTEIRDLVGTLEDRVRERTRELEHANHTKDKFFTIIAHDLKGPISAAHHLVEQLIEQRGCMDESAFTEALTELGISNRNVFRLLENLLLWAQSEQGTLPFDPAPLSLRPLAEECLALHRAPATQKAIALTAELPDVSVIADRDMMSLVLRNLVSNAVKFTPHGGSVRVVAEIEPMEECRIIIEDSGVGIPPHIADSLFSVTSRSRPGTDGERGSGLGLTIVAEFLHRHGTEPTVESRPGGGTRISFRLSLVTARGVVESGAWVGQRPSVGG